MRYSVEEDPMDYYRVEHITRHNDTQVSLEDAVEIMNQHAKVLEFLNSVDLEVKIQFEDYAGGYDTWIFPGDGRSGFNLGPGNF